MSVMIAARGFSYTMLNKTQIESNIEWLLENASLPVKALTYRYILDDKAAADSLAQKIEESVLVKDFFSKQKDDGSWCASGKWANKQPIRKSGYTPVSPKYVTTAWIFPILANLGYTVKDERIQKSINYLMSFQRANGYIGELKPENQDDYKEGLIQEPCRFSIIMHSLARIGAASDPKVQKAFDLLLKWQQKDGGWVSESHCKQQNWTRSCPFSTYHSTIALYYADSEANKPKLLMALNFLLNHLATKKDSEIQRFFYHGHSIIHELLMFTSFKFGIETGTVQSLLQWLMSMYQADAAHFKYSGKPITKYTFKEDYMDSKVAKYRLFQLIEDDWLTYYATRIFLGMG